MNKAYLLVVCLLAASFTGCLSDDTSDLEEQQNTEDETIEPVGTNNNETEDYDALIGEIQNLTDEIEELRLEIEELQASEYQPPENSSYLVIREHCVNPQLYHHPEDREYDEYDNYINQPAEFCGNVPMLEFFKNGNEIVIEYVGLWEAEGLRYNPEVNCTNGLPNINFYNVDGVEIYRFSYFERSSEFVTAHVEGCEPAYDDGNYNWAFEYFWHTLEFDLPEEVVRIGYTYGAYGSGAHYASTETYFTFP